tara:strand:+ start:119 stop:1195 length:1077 start_codon:yes stop_codon:yes gene_type:complete
VVNRCAFLLGFLISALLCFGGGPESFSRLAGFHTELIVPNSVVPVSMNVLRSPGEEYEHSVSELFGRENEARFLEGDVDAREADVIWFMEPDGSWVGVYYDNGWKAWGQGDTDYSYYRPRRNSGFFVQSNSENYWLLVFSGHVRTDPMIYRAYSGFNVFNRGFPIPISLKDSNLHYSPGLRWGDENTADIVYLYEDGEYGQYYCFNGLWRKVGESGDFGDKLIPAAFLVYTRGSGGALVLQPPINLLAHLKSTNEGYLDPAPPPANLSTSLGRNEFGSPVFRISWNAYNHKVRYVTEVLESNWFRISSKIGARGQFMEDHAILLHSFSGLIGLRWGIVRVRSEWIHSSKRRRSPFIVQ